MAPRQARGMTTFRVVVLRLRRMASASRFLQLVFARRGSFLRRLVRPATAGPAPTSRWRGFSRIPPSSGATLFETGRITILSPGRDACCTFASVLKGACREPLPPGRAVALTYQTRERLAAATAALDPAIAVITADVSRQRVATAAR